MVFMKKIIAVICISFLFMNCSSNDDGKIVDTTIFSTILVNGVAFVPDFLKLEPSITGTNENLTFNLMDIANGQSLIVSIQYPENTANSPNGIYDFGIGETGTMLFASGSFTSNDFIYSLAGYTVQVTKLLGNNKYKLDFQNVEAVEINTGNMIIISGTCEGNFN